MKRIELLAPAASPEGAQAAIKNGADAIYLGLGVHNARAGAKNFTTDELSETARLARYAGVKVYVTLNTLVSDRELASVLELAKAAQDAGADAILVQDVGLASVLRESLPDMELHASTQMSVMNAAGANAAFDMGMTRVVAARELSLDSIRTMCEKSRAAVEVFVHGALCFCYSGQCYMSSVIGGRSGNRGACAQPCRLPYGVGERRGEYPLSLKDLSLAEHLESLRAAGVCSLKIEGRMRRPEYAAVVTSVFRRALDERKPPTSEELRVLRLAFSRGGFTDGYLTGDKTEMLGTRGDKQADTNKLFAEARRFYESAPLPRRIGVRFACKLEADKPAVLAAVTEDGVRALVRGAVPERAENRSLTPPEVTTQMYKTGGTPYNCTDARAAVGERLWMPVSELNSLRRAALEALDEQRTALPNRRYLPPEEAAQGSGGGGAALSRGSTAAPPSARPAITAQLMSAEQMSRRLAALKPDMLILPLSVIAGEPERFREVAAACRVAAALPRVLHDGEWRDFLVNLDTALDVGVGDAVVENIGHIAAAQERGFALHGGFGLNVYNSRAVRALGEKGFASVTLSFELSFAEMRDIEKSLPCGIVAYGRLPVMLTEQMVNRYGKGRVVTLVDRKNAAFPVVCGEGGRNVVLNSKKLWLADRLDRAAEAGVSELRLYFTTENARECEQVLERYRGVGAYEPNDFTRRYL